MRPGSALRQSVPTGQGPADSLRPFEPTGRPPDGLRSKNWPGEEGLKACSILVIDDEPDTLSALVELLEEEGYTAQRAAEGAEALALLRGGWRPSLILLDLKMPVMDGAEFLRRVALDADLSEIPVAIVTASATVEKLPDRKRNAGFFSKPIDYERLLRVVRRYCG